MTTPQGPKPQPQKPDPNPVGTATRRCISILDDLDDDGRRRVIGALGTLYPSLVLLGTDGTVGG